MFCKNCGREIVESVKYCPACGTKAIAQIEDSAVEDTDSLKEENYQGEVPNGSEKPKEKHRKVIPLLASLLAVVTVLLIVVLAKNTARNVADDKGDITAVSSSAEVDSEEEQDSESVNSPSATGVAVGSPSQAQSFDDQTKTASIEEAEDAFKRLFQIAFDLVEKEDLESYLDLFVDPDPDNEYVNTLYDFIIGCKENSYEDTCYGMVGGDGTYFVGNVMKSLTSGVYPNTKTMSSYSYCTISYKEGKWKFDNQDEEHWHEIIWKELPQEYIEAEEAGRNAMMIAGIEGGGVCFAWMCSNMVVPGALETNVRLIWQNEDGSVGVLVNIQNGTDEIRNVDKIYVTATDDALGEIFYSEVRGTNIPPNKSENFVFDVPADDIQTGTEAWGIVRVQTRTNNS